MKSAWPVLPACQSIYSAARHKTHSSVYKSKSNLLRECTEPKKNYLFEFLPKEPVTSGFHRFINWHGGKWSLSLTCNCIIYLYPVTQFFVLTPNLKMTCAEFNTPLHPRYGTWLINSFVSIINTCFTRSTKFYQVRRSSLLSVLVCYAAKDNIEETELLHNSCLQFRAYE